MKADYLTATPKMTGMIRLRRPHWFLRMIGIDYLILQIEIDLSIEEHEPTSEYVEYAISGKPNHSFWIDATHDDFPNYSKPVSSIVMKESV